MNSRITKANRNGFIVVLVFAFILLGLVLEKQFNEDFETFRRPEDFLRSFWMIRLDSTRLNNVRTCVANLTTPSNLPLDCHGRTNLYCEYGNARKHFITDTK